MTDRFSFKDIANRIRSGRDSEFGEPFTTPSVMTLQRPGEKSDTTTTTTGGSVQPAPGSSIRVDRNDADRKKKINKNDVKVVGDYITDKRIATWEKAQRIHFFYPSLKPGARVFGYIKGENVTQYIYRDAGAPNSPTSKRGGPIRVPSDGRLFVTLQLPAGKFLTGQVALIMSNNPDLFATGKEGKSRTRGIAFFNVPSRRVFGNTGKRAFYEPPVERDGNTRDKDRPTKSEDWAYGISDPLCQTVKITENYSKGQEGIFVDKIDLYFKEKSERFGVTVEIRETQNGVPTEKTLPYSEKHLDQASINVSENATAATTFAFDSPVFLQAGKEYAISVTPSGHSPEYRIWTAEVGKPDINNSDKTVNKNWGEGKLFHSTNGTRWIAVPNEDLKFTLYRRKVTSATGDFDLVNGDYEFLTIENLSDTFIEGEMVFKDVSSQTGTVSITDESATIVGSGTAFTTDFAVGQWFVVSDSGATQYNIRTIKTITDDTNMELDGICTFTDASGLHYKTIVGLVDTFDSERSDVILSESTALSPNLFEAADTVKNEDASSFDITSVDNRTISDYQPDFSKILLSGTDVSFDISGTNSVGSPISTRKVKTGKLNTVVDDEMMVYSKSNEAGTKSLTVNVNMTLGTDDQGNLKDSISPIVDIDGCDLFCYGKNINNDTTNEIFGDGNAKSRYLSRRITLADGMDAEDIKVYITGYRPKGTDIKVYVKALNSSDNDDFNNKLWSELEYTGGGSVYSDPTDITNYIEYELGFKAKPEVTSITGVADVTTGSTTISGSGTSFDTDFADGDYALITNTPFSNDYQVVRVDGAPASATSMTVSDEMAFTNNSCQIEKVTYPEMAFLNPQNNNIVRYADANGTDYDTYKTYAIKIVLVSDSAHIIPKVKDLRAIALSV